jgi:hypothetical protein
MQQKETPSHLSHAYLQSAAKTLPPLLLNLLPHAGSSLRSTVPPELRRLSEICHCTGSSPAGAPAERRQAPALCPACDVYCIPGQQRQLLRLFTAGAKLVCCCQCGVLAISSICCCHSHWLLQLRYCWGSAANSCRCFTQPCMRCCSTCRLLLLLLLLQCR